ncbi:solute carrier family 35 member F3-like isoform X3 [Hyla sarda]|nr:solute carrier family 35 member F3-like isoform X3 [Hyla sarda]
MDGALCSWLGCAVSHQSWPLFCGALLHVDVVNKETARHRQFHSPREPFYSHGEAVFFPLDTMDVPLSPQPGWKLGPHSVTAVLVMKRILPICSLSLLARSLYFLALRSLCTSEAAALYSCNKAFCYLLSWTILRDQFLGTRVVAVICCMAGVVMMSYAERPEEEAQNGQILALSAAVVTAFNEVLFRLLIGRLNSQESAIFLGLCSICSSLFLWWIPLLIYLQQPIEVPELSAAPSMEYLSVTVILFFLFQFMEKIGVQFFPTSGVSLGIFLSVAVITAVDHRWEVPSTGKLMGILAIGIGTVLVIVPENWEEYLGLEFSEQFHQEDIPEETKSKSSLSAL